MKAWALIVGINQYPPLSGQKALQGAVADACDFADWALDPNGGGVPPERLYFWTFPAPPPQAGALADYLAQPALPDWDNDELDWAPPDMNRRPRAAEIVQTLMRVGRKAHVRAFEEGDTETRRVYVFFAGHGLRAKEFGDLTEQTCFVAGDFRPIESNVAQGLVGCESLRKALLNDRFNEALLFLDCCRLETSRLAMSVQVLSDYVSDPATIPWGVGNAAQDGYVAYETVSAPVRGVFSKTLMAGLRTCRDGATNALHVKQLEDFVLANIASNTDTGQQPSFRYNPNPPGPVIVTGGAAPAPAQPILHPGPPVNLAALPAGTQVILIGADDAPVPGVGPLTAGPAPVPLPPLPAGLYSLQVVGSPGRETLFRQPRTEPVDVA
jgi:hypothetical protein